MGRRRCCHCHCGPLRHVKAARIFAIFAVLVMITVTVLEVIHTR